MKPQNKSGQASRFDPRAEAVDVLVKVDRSDANADELSAAVMDRHRDADPRDRGLFFEIVMGVLRMRGTLDWFISKASSRGLEQIEPAALQAIRVATYQLVCLDRIPPHAAVNECVNLVKAICGEGPARFVNAVMRKISSTVADSAAKEKAIAGMDRPSRLSHPEWMVRVFDSSMGSAGTDSLCAANNSEPPLTIRATVNLIGNSAGGGRERLAAILASEGFKTTPCRYAPQALLLDRSPVSPLAPVFHARSFQDGLWTVQDEAAQLVSLALDPRPGERVLDACAAPGGKTAHIADLMNRKGEIIAVDRDSRRSALLKETVKRLNLSSVRLMVADASAKLDFGPDGF
ncbi:MAG: transcription antitermination factor NusB, partial [Myxococcota bacterium]